MRYILEFEGVNGWTRWIPIFNNRHRIICCDCGLAHDLEFKIVGWAKQIVKFRAHKNMRSTAQIRKHHHKAKEIEERPSPARSKPDATPAKETQL